MSEKRRERVNVSLEPDICDKATVEASRRGLRLHEWIRWVISAELLRIAEGSEARNG